MNSVQPLYSRSRGEKTEDFSGISPPSKIFYPESDGKPMAENTTQYNYNSYLKWGLEYFFEKNPDVFVAGDLFWYPVEGKPKICTAPDAMVVFGAKKGERGSYKQWEEGNIVPQVVFEVLSPGNKKKEMNDKLRFYEKYGVEEYYLYNPMKGNLKIWLREKKKLKEQIKEEEEDQEYEQAWKSPRLQLLLSLSGKEGKLEMYNNNKKIPSFMELKSLYGEAEEKLKKSRALSRKRKKESIEAEKKRRKAEEKRTEAEEKRTEAEAVAKKEKKARMAAEKEKKKLLLLLKKAGINPA